MSAEKFFERQKDALRTVNQKLKEKGKKVSSFVEANVSDTVEESLNTIVSDFKSTVGAVSSALESLAGDVSSFLSSAKDQASTALSATLKAIETLNAPGGFLSGGFKIQLPTFKIGNITVNSQELAGLVEDASKALVDSVNKAASTLLDDLSKLESNKPNPITTTDSFGELVVQNEAEVKRLVQEGEILEGTLVKTRDENKYYISQNRFDNKSFITLYEYNKERKEKNERPIFPKGGHKVGKAIDGVAVIDPKPEPPEKTASSKKV